MSWFNKRLSDDELVLKPLFQRNPVWTSTQKSYLIDSILRGYPVPEIYLQTTEDKDGNDRHIVVDGQQRIRACLEFLAGNFALSERDADWDGARFDDLTKDQKTALRQYRFAVRVLPALDETLIREIFGRLNRNNMALNKQELRNATYWGEFITTMNRLADDPFWVDSGIFTVNDFRRMLDVEFISELAIAALYGQQNKKDNVDRLYGEFEEEFPARAETESTFQAVCQVLTSVVDWDSSTRWKRKSDFYTLFAFYAEQTDSLPLAKDEVERQKARLAAFSASISTYLADDETPATEEVRDYARYVQRAASDLQSRRVRLAALRAHLTETAYTRPTGTKSATPTSKLDALKIEVEPEAEVDEDSD
ncbi:DUF262 domain-containing protein [Microbacterium sp. Mcb102]|uniref:DUF262 domain-containing protein n=1 Tax=Microbacterium sp. Mcb102 TaxID=2926012 RepID=UPI0021C75C7B|nr:DUF262 domain-containing protein [Microbacterium sp. Mcb102]